MTNRKPDQNHDHPVSTGTSEDDSLISVTEEKEVIRPDTVDDIDDFARALLNQKVEMALYPNGKEQKKPAEPSKGMTLQEAESTMSYALDQLRRERGQLPIETEEENFEWQQLRNYEPEPEEDALTTQSIIQERKDAQNATLTSLYDSKPEHEVTAAPRDKSEYFEKTETREESKRHERSPKKKQKSKTQKASKEKKPQHSSASSEKKESLQKPAASKQKQDFSKKKPDEIREIASDPRKKAEAELFNFEPQPEPGKPAPKPKMKKKAVWAIVLIILAVLCLFGGYVYKVMVYDPAHNVSEAQETSYKKLQQYADEYEMASDAEKIELLDLNADYNALNETQKKSISEYFKEQTGMDYAELRASLQKQKDDQKAQNSASYNALLDYVNSWNDLSSEEKQQIKDKISDFNSLSEEQKAKIDEIMQQNTGMTFIQQADTTDIPADDPVPSGEDSNETGQTDEQKEMQTILNQLIEDRASYAEFLAEEGLDYDDVMAEYDSNIEYYQNLLNHGQ